MWTSWDLDNLIEMTCHMVAGTISSFINSPLAEGK